MQGSVPTQLGAIALGPAHILVNPGFLEPDLEELPG